MPFVLRGVNKAKWYKNPNVPWLAEGELQADALKDIRTEANALSVYYIEDGEANLERVITALAAARDHLDKFDYALVDYRSLEAIDAPLSTTLGETPDGQVNQWHRDVIKLSAAKLLELARTIQASNQIRRVPEKQVGRLLIQGVSSGHLDTSKMKPRLLSKLDL